MKQKLDIITKQLSILSMLLCLISCNFLSKETRAQEMEEQEKQLEQETVDDYTDNYTITPNYEHPKFKELSDAFAKQAHRFEIDACEFKYNGKSFFIGDSMEKIVEVFGEPDRKIETLDKSSLVCKYKLFKLSISFSTREKNIESFSIRMSDYRGNEDTVYRIIVFRGVPYQLDMTLNQFMELSDLNHDKLRHNVAAFYIRQKECAPSKEERIYTSIDSTPAYDSVGGGHLTLRGDFDPNVTGVIKSFYVGKETLEEIKKNW